MNYELKEMAKRLVMEYMWGTNHTQPEAKSFALITVNQCIINSKELESATCCSSYFCGCKEYWKQIKHEIEQL